jgi:cytochrome c peroxidase
MKNVSSALQVVRVTALCALLQFTQAAWRAMRTGKFADLGKFKGPILRGLAPCAPYFHNGSAQTLQDVVNFYSARFNIGFTAQQKSYLTAFLNSL